MWEAQEVEEKQKAGGRRRKQIRKKIGGGEMQGRELRSERKNTVKRERRAHRRG